MQLTKTNFSDSTIFTEKNRVESLLWAKSEFLWAKKMHHLDRPSVKQVNSVTLSI